MKHSVEKWSVSISQWRNLEVRINIQWIQDSETQAIAKYKRINQLKKKCWPNILMIAKKIKTAVQVVSPCAFWNMVSSPIDKSYEKKHKTVS